MKPICRSAQLVLLAAAALLTPPALAQTPPAAWLPAVLHLLLACTPEPGASVCLPRVALTTPANASFFSPPATIQLAATASDEDGSITKVEFYNGTALLTSVLTPPYQFTWNNVGIGTYALTAKAYSSQGASRTSPAANVTVSVNQLPVVSLLAPANNSAVGPPGNVRLSASTYDPDGLVTKVEFYRDAVLVATVADSPYVAQVTGLAPGTYSFTARAHDSRGGVTPSAAANVTVTAVPAVTLTTPSATLASGAVVSLSATASDSDGSITRIEIYRGAQLLGTGTSASYSLSVPSLPDGHHVFTAKAYDNLGLAQESAAVRVTIGSVGAAVVTYTYDDLG